MYLHGIELAQHQLESIQLIGVAHIHDWPMIIVECESKIVPEEMHRVLAIVIPDKTENKLTLVPVARLFEETPLSLLYEPKVGDRALVIDRQIAPYGGWKLELP